MNLINRKGQVLLADDTAPDFTALLRAAIAQGINLDDADFSNQVIEDLTIENMTLSRVRMDTAQFKNVKFRNVILESCIANNNTFNKTDFLRCKLGGCNLYQNKFTFCEIKNTVFDRFRCFDNHFINGLLENTKFLNARICGNILEGYSVLAELMHPDFGLHQVIFIRSKVNANTFKNLSIKRCSFQNSTFRSNKIDSAQIQSSEFPGTDLSHSSLCNSSFSNTAFSYQLLKDLRVFRSEFETCQFSAEAMINMASLETTYSNCHFTHPEGADLQITFEACLLEKTKFSGSHFLKGTFTSCSLDGSDFEHSNLVDCTLKDCTLYGTRLKQDQTLKLEDCHFMEARRAVGPAQPRVPPLAAIVISSDEEDDKMDED